MKSSKKELRAELKRMKASLSEIAKPKKRKLDPSQCLDCKNDAGNNFVFVYKKNSELKGKRCISCHHGAMINKQSN